MNLVIFLVINFSFCTSDYTLFDTTSPSNNVTLPMCSNLDEEHVKCAGNLVIQRLQKIPSVFMNPWNIIFLPFIIM